MGRKRKMKQESSDYEEEVSEEKPKVEKKPKENLTKEEKAALGKEKKVQCEVCGARFYNNCFLKMHMRRHTKEKPYACKVCGMKFSNPSNKIKHEARHAGYNYPCTYCGRLFTDKDYLAIHARTHTGERPFSCETCGKTFRQSDVLSKHRKIHKGDRPHECNICGFKFVLKGALNRHMKLHKGLKPWECNICHKKFSRRENLIVHKKTHLKGEDRYFFLTKGFSSAEMENFSMMSDDEEEDETPDLGISMIGRTPIETGLCVAEDLVSAEVNGKSSLAMVSSVEGATVPSCHSCETPHMHLNIKPDFSITATLDSDHSALGSSVSDSALSSDAPDASKGELLDSADTKPTFPDEAGNSEHVEAKLKPETKAIDICTQLGEVLVERDASREISRAGVIHIRPPSPLPNFADPDWETKRVIRELLDQGDTSTNLDSNKLLEKIASFSVKGVASDQDSITGEKLESFEGEGKENLGERQSYKLSGEPFCCGDCDLRFAKYNTLIKHMEIHTKDYKYVCNVCGILFIEQSVLKQHLLTHQEKKTYSCTVCDKSFAKSLSLSIHSLVHETPKSIE